MDRATVSNNAVSQDVRARAAKIKVLLMDVDGVLTDGNLYYYLGPGERMVETKGFNSHDGLGLHFIHAAGLKAGVISGRESPAMVERAKILKMRYVYQGLLDKKSAYEEILADAHVSDEAVCFIGDDFTDAPLIRRAGLGVAVANARPEVKDIAHLVTARAGGQGAVREVIEIILKEQNLWQDVLSRYSLD